MAAFDPGDIAVGGKHEYITVYHSDFSLSQLVHVTDTGSITGDTDSGLQTLVTGVTFRPPTGDLFSTSTPDWNLPNSPHDCDWIPDDSGILAAIVPTAGSILFRKYGFDGSVLGSWSPAVEPGFSRQHVKISVACDSSTVFYTSQQKRIKRFSLTTGQLTDYKVLDPSSPYIFGGIRTLPTPRTTGDLRHVIVAMTLDGEGPRNAVCLDSDGVNFWHDIVNPTGDYTIQKRDIETGATLIHTITTVADLDDLNDETLALACNFNQCFFARRFVGFTSVNG